MIADAQKSAKEVLNSWKEIAVYLNRGVRTVQRWEAELGLPLRRPHGRRHSSVTATRAELDAWMASRPLVDPQDGEDGGPRIIFDRDGVRFLFIEIESGLTFASLAGSAAPHQVEKFQRNRENARKAYRTVLKFRELVALDETETLRLNTGLERLKTTLESLE